MGKAWKRFNHRRRTWGAKQEAPPAPKVKVAEPIEPEPAAEVAAEVAEEASTTSSVSKTKTSTGTKRTKRKTVTAKKK